MVKRAVDLTCATVGLLVLSPVMLIVALVIRCAIGRPVLFRQTRPGFLARPFSLLKFRTMREAKDSRGRLLPDAARLTNTGKWIRRLSLDELPQLCNVLQGDMSLVGPRPLLMQYLPYFSEKERLRFSVRPGITGLAQVNGRNDLRWDDRIAFDVWYVENWSLSMDFKILGLTLWRVFRHDGVRVDPGAVMQNLDEERRSRLHG
jgi:lipopolysaccharide/colanic/teichoic acid biosynthesis glycosyltransferase